MIPQAWPAAIGEFLAVAFGRYGYPLAFVGAMLENTILLGLVLPGGSIVLAAAAYARLGPLSWPIVLLLGWAGMIAGCSIDYWIGRKALRPLLGRFGHRASFNRELERARAFLTKHGIWAVASGHFLGHLRSFIALAAGSSHFAYPRYLLFEALAALVWNTLYCGLGYLLASQLDLVRTIFERIGLVGVGLIILALAGFLIVRRVRSRRRRAS